jgi:hypothetical protein
MRTRRRAVPPLAPHGIAFHFSSPVFDPVHACSWAMQPVVPLLFVCFCQSSSYSTAATQIAIKLHLLFLPDACNFL